MGELSAVSLLVKPVSGRCNMRCDYCFYFDEAKHRQREPAGIMREETVRELVDAAFSAADPRAEISFAFQGGEPTLAGLDFFVRFCEMVRGRNTAQQPVRWSIQTNGLLLDERWASFLKENRFLVGLSLDGTAALHDSFRRDASGRKTYSRVLRSARLLKEYEVPVNLLCVVTEPAARRPVPVYEALKALGVPFLQFIPCLNPLDAKPRRLPWSLSADSFGRFLCAVFDRWEADWQRGEYVSVRQFEDWLRLAMGQPPEMCASCGSCGGYLVAEADGSLYPCDFYVLDEWRLGDLRGGLLSALDSEKMRQFRRRLETLPADCPSCPHASLCQGGCPRNWKTEKSRIVNELCPAFRMFFAYAEPRIRRLSGLLAPPAAPLNPAPISDPKPSL